MEKALENMSNLSNIHPPTPHQSANARGTSSETLVKVLGTRSPTSLTNSGDAGEAGCWIFLKFPYKLVL